jgi:hypothetical protein
LTLALDGGEWSVSRPCRFIPRERSPRTYWIGGWVGPKVGLDAVEKKKNLTLAGIESGPSSPSLYRPSYPDSGTRSAANLTNQNVYNSGTHNVASNGNILYFYFGKRSVRISDGTRTK